MGRLDHIACGYRGTQDLTIAQWLGAGIPWAIGRSIVGTRLSGLDVQGQ